MYKAIYDYTAQDDGLLSFPVGSSFNLIEQLDDHWWSMLDESGNSGLVPASFLEVNQIGQQEVIDSIDRSLDAMQDLLAASGGTLKDSDKRNIHKLLKNRKAIAEEVTLWGKDIIPQQPKREAPKVPVTPTSPNTPVTPITRSTSNDGSHRRKSKKRYSAPLPPTDQLPFATNKSKLNSSLDENNKLDSSLDENNENSLTSRSGTSSKIYNIQVSQGAVTPSEGSSTKTPYTFDVSVTQNQTKKTMLTTATELNNSYVISKVNGLDNQAKSSDVNDTTPINELVGQHLRISKIDDASPYVSIEERLGIKTKTNMEEYGSTPSLDSFTSGVTTCSNATTSKHLNQVHIADEFGKELIDVLRSRCTLSFNKSLAAVRCVLYNIAKEIPEVGDVMERIQKQIQDDNLSVHKGLLSSEDEIKLRAVLDELTQHKEDSQQRNWAVHEDFQTIKDLLNQLLTVMDEIDPSICRTVLQEDDYMYINNLIVYYQMEARPKLRISLLHAFGCFCQLGHDFISQILCSVLPTELAQDLMQDQSDLLKFLSTSLMLTMIFSTGEPVPYHHYVQLNEVFIDFLLDSIEDPPSNDDDDQVGDAVIATLLAFNQHFKAWAHNTVMQVIARRKIFRTLTEKILLLLNREIDPVVMFEFHLPCPDSVLKFLLDLFASKETCGIFFTNDLYVLIEIILRQITDRQPKDKVRTEYLSLFHSLLNTTNYHEHKHQIGGFKRCFQNILENKEDLENEVDVYIVREIINRFPHLFQP